nr:hypothetical protein CFP56_01302 [Quercus suber]
MTRPLRSTILKAERRYTWCLRYEVDARAAAAEHETDRESRLEREQNSRDSAQVGTTWLCVDRANRYGDEEGRGTDARAVANTKL